MIDITAPTGHVGLTIVRRPVDAGPRDHSHAEADLRRPSLETGASESFADAGATVFAKVGGPGNAEDTLRPKVESAA